MGSHETLETAISVGRLFPAGLLRLLLLALLLCDRDEAFVEGFGLLA
jgi:hypothetical protein